jgi:hypothetical protein
MIWMWPSCEIFIEFVNKFVFDIRSTRMYIGNGERSNIYFIVYAARVKV